MHTRSPSKHPLHSFSFWFLILGGATILAAWKFGFTPQGRPVTQEFVPAPEPESRITSMPGLLGEAAARPRVLDERVQSDLSATVSLNTPEGQASTPGWAQNSDHQQAGVQVAMANAEQNGVARISFTPAAPANSQLQAGGQEAPLQEVVNEDVAASVQVEINEALKLVEAGDDVGGHRLLSTLYWTRPAARPALNKHLRSLAEKIYFSRTHYLDAHVVQQGETLQGLAQQYNVPWEYLAGINQVDPATLSAGTELKVMQGPFHAKVELSRFELTVHSFGYFVASFPIGVGHEQGKPTGVLQVTEKLNDPTYYGAGDIIDHDDPKNPLGEHLIELNDSSGSLIGAGIHGTIDPDSIGELVTQGFIRLRNEDIEKLFDLLSIGSQVEIVE